MWHPCWSGMVVAIATQRRVARRFDSWFLAKGNWLDSYYCCRPGDTVLIAPGITHMASNVVITKPLRLVSILVLFLARVLGPGIWNWFHYFVIYIYMFSFVRVFSIMWLSKSWDTGYWIVHIFNRWEVEVQLMTLFFFAPEALTGETYLLTW